MLTHSSLNMNAGSWWIKYFVFCITKLTNGRSMGPDGGWKLQGEDFNLKMKT